jgi:hypothetical protein
VLVPNDASPMSGPHTALDLSRARDLEGRAQHPLVRRGLLAVLAIPVVLALSGAIGQRTQTVVGDGAGAGLQVQLPDTLRGGLMWRSRILVRARTAIAHPRLVLGRGFFEGMQANTIEPSPQSEASRGERVVLSYSALKPGDELVVYLQFQVNPTTVGNQDTSVELDDEAAPLARAAHTTTVLP